MAQLHELKTFTSENGNLTVFNHSIPGVIQRVFYIYGAGQATRAGHRHYKAWHALICLHGSCRVYCDNGRGEVTFRLIDPRQCLVLRPEDWHTLDEFSPDAILLVISNERYDKDDYIYEPYSTKQRSGESIMAGQE